MSRREMHIAPPQRDLDYNKLKEPDGERLRAELTEWLARNNIVSIMLDTESHCVSIDIAPKLPQRIKPVLSLWGSIYVGGDMECPHCHKDMGMLAHGVCEKCKQFCGCSWEPTSYSDYCTFHDPRVERAVKSLDRGSE